MTNTEHKSWIIAGFEDYDSSSSRFSIQRAAVHLPLCDKKKQICILKLDKSLVFQVIRDGTFVRLGNRHVMSGSWNWLILVDT